jgi:hypothetical protein
LKVRSQLEIAEEDLVKSVLLQEADQQDQKLILKTANKSLVQKLDQNLVRLEVQKLETAPVGDKAKAKL